MTRKLLTDKSLKALKPAKAGKRYITWDSQVPHLGVRVTDKGARTFVVIRRRPGDAQPLRYTIGPYNPHAEAGGVGTLAHARAQARDALAAITAGKHPAELEEERRREEAKKRKDTVETVVDEFIQRHVSRLRSGRAIGALLRRELLGQRRGDGGWVVDPKRKPNWRDKPITLVTRRDVVELLEAVTDRGAVAQARRLHAHMSKLFNWALHRDTYGLEVSPVARVKAADMFGEAPSRERVLNDDELRCVWNAADTMAYPYGVLVKTLMLTGQRLREISDAKWSEIENGSLVVPGARMKAKEALSVPLTPAVLLLLESVPRFEGGEFIFTTTHGRRPISGFSKYKARLDRAADVRVPWVTHDLRRTVRTRLSQLGIAPHISELVIGHRQGGIVRVYDLHSYGQEKLDALLRWERHLLGIVQPSEPVANVVALGRRS